MPVITIDLAPITREKKAQLVQTMTRDASEITGIPQDKFVVLIRELERDNIGVGGAIAVGQASRYADSLISFHSKFPDGN